MKLIIRIDLDSPDLAGEDGNLDGDKLEGWLQGFGQLMGTTAKIDAFTAMRKGTMGKVVTFAWEVTDE